MHADATPMLITPFLSEESRAICVDHDVGYLDLHGNAFFHVPGVLIDIGVPGRPAAKQRDLKSLFRPKAAHILRIMLRDPKRAWRVSDLAAASEASLGHVSNVRRALLSREWAREEAGGVALTDPDALLDAWRDAYRRPAGELVTFHTALHGHAFEEAAKQVWSEHSFRRWPATSCCTRTRSCSTWRGCWRCACTRRRTARGWSGRRPPWRWRPRRSGCSTRRSPCCCWSWPPRRCSARSACSMRWPGTAACSTPTSPTFVST